jgi:uncharacterized protein YajQ (UPF0234 family)
VDFVAKDASFDIVSEVNEQEVDNAVNQAAKEILTRFDFKGSKSDIKFDGKVINLISDDEFKLASLVDVLKTKCVKRDISLKSLKFGKIESASGGTVRQVVDLQQGIEQDVSKQITKLIKDSKIKVQVTIQGDQVRVSGKDRDDLQAVIQLLKGEEFPIPLQFSNYR